MLSPINLKISQKLKDKGYRDRFFRGRAQDEVAYQLRAARKKRKLTQPELEKLSRMKQSAISRIEQASYSRWNFKTLLRIAEALDLRIRVRFDYAEDVIREYKWREAAADRQFLFVRNTLAGSIDYEATKWDGNISEDNTLPPYFKSELFPTGVVQ